MKKREAGRWFWFLWGTVFACWGLVDFRRAFDARPIAWGSGLWGLLVMILGMLLAIIYLPSPILRFIRWGDGENQP